MDIRTRRVARRRCDVGVHDGLREMNERDGKKGKWRQRGEGII